MKKISFDTMMAASMAACALLAACSGNGDDSPRLPVVQNIVEYAGTSEEIGRAHVRTPVTH